MALILNIFIIIVLIAILVMSYLAFTGRASWGQLRLIGVPSAIFIWIQVVFYLVLAADAFAIVSYIIGFPVWIDVSIFVVILALIFFIVFRLLQRPTFNFNLFVPLVLIPLSVPGVGYVGKMVKTGAITLTDIPIVKFVKTGSNKKTTPAFRQGDDPSIKTVILLSAPGKFEAKAGRPAAGETGKTLQLLIEKLHAKDPRSFPSSKLDDYTIANADETIHYSAKTGRTEATKNEIITSSNMERINNILKDNNTVLAFGNNAQYALKNSSFTGLSLTAPHPSQQSLNRQYKSDKVTPSERKLDRISQWFDELFN